MELEAHVELRQDVFKVQQFKTCSSEGAIMKGQSKNHMALWSGSIATCMSLSSGRN